MTYIVDTHGLVWFLEGSPQLSTAAQTAPADATAQVVVPTIVLAEITFLYARHRITVNPPQVLTPIANAANCVVYPLDGAVEVARDLGYRLYTICERMKWSQEALVYNRLVIAWAEIARLAGQSSP
jgi:hypothetical protein